MKTEILFNYNNFYPKYGTQQACPYDYNTHGTISMSSLTKKEKMNLVTCITRIFEEIIKLIICFACFYNFVKHLNN